mgnify:CR=1 FL=1
MAPYPAQAATNKDTPPSIGITDGPGGSGVAMMVLIKPEARKIPVAKNKFLSILVCEVFGCSISIRTKILKDHTKNNIT